MEKREFWYPSKDGKTQIHAIEWMPQGEPCGILQICHGMVEYIERYQEFGEFLSKHGYYVVGHDHLGHGKSVVSEDKLGFFAEKDGNACVIADIHKLRELTEEKYPATPYMMLGHSMGSFLLRQYLGIHSDGLAGAIIMGTGQQPDMVLGAGKLLCKLLGKTKGWNHRSSLVNGIAIGAYNKRFKKEGCIAAWLSKNIESIMKYANDPLCTYVFTVNAYYNMFTGMQRMNKQEKEGKLPKDLPLLITSGQDDPVGNFGKSVENLYKFYQKSGCKDVTLKLYPGDRHEILNELDRENVYQDILSWMEIRKKPF